MIYSFDIFDTCVVRKCGVPSNIFEIMSLFAFNANVTSEARRAFVTARIDAERISFSKNQTLSDIYTAFDFKHDNLLPKDELLRLEENIEYKMLVPVKFVVDKIRECRQKRGRIIFISDMYHRSNFLKSVLEHHRIWHEGDHIYVSCENGSTKSDGGLYEIIRKKESVSYNDWCHFGDNIDSDVKVPRKYGIHARQILSPYSLYQSKMKAIPSLSFNWGSVLSGISRSIFVQNDKDSHKLFFVDIIAPLLVSFVCRVVKDAQKRGFSKLFFCSRDAYPLYRIAKKFEKKYTDVSIEYLYISRKSLYECSDDLRLGYFKQIGLASKVPNDVAIVDVHSSGQTLYELNSLFEKNGFNRVFGYFFELCSNGALDFNKIDYSCELDSPYLLRSGALPKQVVCNWYMYELFFPLNNLHRTIGYQKTDSGFTPVLETEDKKEYKLSDLDKWVEWRNETLDDFVEYFMQCNLFDYVDSIFECYAIPALADFFTAPDKYYLKAISGLYGQRADGTYSLFVDNNLWRLPFNIFKHKTLWRRGTIFFSLPRWLCLLLYNNK